jgi:DNA-binding response OmpR family regulator
MRSSAMRCQIVGVDVPKRPKKLGDASDFIETVRGLGYRFRETEAASPE